MTPSRRFRRALVLCALVGAALTASSTDAEATHFRYGSITWQIANPATPNIVTLRFDSVWRRSFGWIPSSPSVGQIITGQIVSIDIRNSSGDVVAVLSPTATVTAVNAAEDWFAATYTTTINLPAGVYTARFTACCRLSTLKGTNADRDFLVTAGITVRVPPNAVNQPPTASTLPIVKLARNQAATFPIPAADPNGDAIEYRLATPAESMLLSAAPAGLALSSTGIVTWTPEINGLYAIQVRVTDSLGAHTVVDLILEVVDAVGLPPEVLINNTAGPKKFTTVHSTPFSFAVKGTDPENRPVMLTSSSLPIGATMTPSLPTTAIDATTTFTWTPTPAHVGTYVMNFAALDGDGRQSSQSVTLTVTNNLPTIACVASDGHIEAVGPTGAPFSVTADVDDLDNDKVAVSVLIDGVIRQTSGLLTAPSTVAFSAMQPLGTHTYEVRVSDGLGAAACTGAFTVRDTSAPTIITPDDITVTAASASGTTVTYHVQANDIVDPTPTLSCAPPAGSAFPIGATTVTCTAVDDAGNDNAATFIVTVADPSAPVVTPTVTGTEGLNNWHVGDVMVSWTTVDPESGISSSTGCDTTVIATDTAGTLLTCTATNGSELSTTASLTIKRDATAPVVTFTVASIAAEATGPSGAAVAYGAPAATDHVSGVVGTIVCSAASGSTFPIGPTTVTCTAKDDAGNSGSAHLALTVADTIAPAFGAFTDVVAEATDSAGAAVTYTSPTVTDAVDATPQIVCAPVSGSTFARGQTTVSCTATDGGGNTTTTSMNVTVRDTAAPSIAPLADISVQGTGPSGAIATWTANATDAVDGSMVVTCAPTSGSTFSYGPTTVACAVTDEAGNSASASFIVRVTDATPPVITPVVSGTLGENGWYITDVTVSWNIADDRSAVTPAAGCAATSVSSDGAAFVFTCTATSAGGSTSQSVTVKRDATVPALGVPANVAAQATSPAGALVSYAAVTAIDLASGVAAVSCLPASGSSFPIGTTVVHCTARDGAGLASTVSFTSTVHDTVAPVILSVTPSKSVLWPPNNKMVPIAITVIATDNLGVAPACSISDVTSSEVAKGRGGNRGDDDDDGDHDRGDDRDDDRDGDRNGGRGKDDDRDDRGRHQVLPDWLMTGPLSLQLRAERAGGDNDRLYTIAVRCTDAAGNAATSSTTVRVTKSRRNK